MKKKKLAISLNLDMTSDDLPPFFSVVINGRIAGSGHPNKSHLREQIEYLSIHHNIRGILSLTEDGLDKNVMSVVSIDYMHLSIIDKTPPTIQQLSQGAMFVDEVNAKGGVALVHCKEGIGRTGTMIAGWMMLSLGKSAQDSIDEVKEKRVGSIHQHHQELRLRQLAKVIADPVKLLQLREGRFDETLFDFAIIKAACALLLARTNKRSLLHVYYSRLLINCKNVQFMRCVPKFMEQQRSPVWKPKLTNFETFIKKRDSLQALSRQVSTCSTRSRKGQSTTSLHSRHCLSDLAQPLSATCSQNIEYLQAKHIAKMVEDAVHEILRDRPLYPAVYLSDWFKARSHMQKADNTSEVDILQVDDPEPEQWRDS
eukprot:TRINITY_DN26895_c0_g1_i1.p1 TRINITY_DN26895_c0_g1~~TRINITY_DN26895_c0_g1_i1.p1  ORF type:complete len:383 (+),score=65.29 TRINITY_DN26895_c0_g1_i1:42-1151(+)